MLSVNSQPGSKLLQRTGQLEELGENTGFDLFFLKPRPFKNKLFLFGCARSKVVAHRILSCNIQILSCDTWELTPGSGIKPGLLHWEPEFLATRPPGKSHTWAERFLVDQELFSSCKKNSPIFSALPGAEKNVCDHSPQEDAISPDHPPAPAEGSRLVMAELPATGLPVKELRLHNRNRQADPTVPRTRTAGECLTSTETTYSLH